MPRKSRTKKKQEDEELKRRQEEIEKALHENLNLEEGNASTSTAIPQQTQEIPHAVLNPGPSCSGDPTPAMANPVEKILGQNKSNQYAGPSRSESGGDRMPMVRPIEEIPGQNWINRKKTPDKKVTLSANFFRINFNGDQLYMYLYNLKIEKNDQKLKKESTSGQKSSCVSKKTAREIKKRLVEENFPADSYNIVFDGVERIYCHRRLRSPTRNEDLEEEVFIVNLSNAAFKVTLTFTKHIKNDLNPEYLQSLEALFKEHLSSTEISQGRALYYKQSSPLAGLERIAAGVVACTGFYLTVRSISEGLALNVDCVGAAFYRSGPVLEYLDQVLNGAVSNHEHDLCLNKRTKEITENALRGRRVRVTHRDSHQKFTVRGLTEQTTAELTFTTDREPHYEIARYFKDTYQKQIEYLKLPCLDLSKSNDKPNYVPMELCEIDEGQGCPRDKLSKGEDKLVKYERPNPQVRQQRITGLMVPAANNGLTTGDFIGAFRMNVAPAMAEVQGRMLEKPKIMVADPTRPSIVPNNNGSWILTTLLQSKSINRWGFLIFTDKATEERFATIFIANLMNRCEQLGMSSAQPINRFCRTKILDDGKELTAILDKFSKNHQVEILICLMPRRHNGYNTLKYVAEIRIGLLTQCCLWNARRPYVPVQYLTNLVLKINAKLGGKNFTVENIGDTKTMYFGADVNHPGAGDEESDSVAAMVATMDSDCTQYKAAITFHRHRQEEIQHLKEMSKHLLEKYLDIHRVLPERIVFFRDGVSESQFHMVLNKEFDQLVEAIREVINERKEEKGIAERPKLKEKGIAERPKLKEKGIAGHIELPKLKEKGIAGDIELPKLKEKGIAQDIERRPRLTLTVATKRHRTRLFTNRRITYQNVWPGTVVDNIIVHPQLFDFYLCSHHGEMGTSKPTHYHVLLDENNFRPRDLQELINKLCYTFPRCTKPISLVPPVYFADLAAYRGRLYLEQKTRLGVRDCGKQVEGSTSPYVSPVHKNVADYMFFC